MAWFEGHTVSATATGRGRVWLPLVAALALAAGGLQAAPASAASGGSGPTATFSGGAGTVSVGGVLYAKQGGALTLSVSTDSSVHCVDVSGALSAHQTSGSVKTSWTFPFTALGGDGPQVVTVSAAPGINPNDKCTGNADNTTASYVLDNTGPVVSGALSPAPNAAGWSNADTSVTWSAMDAGSGPGSGPTPTNDAVTTNTPGLIKTATATDRLGNTATGSVAVKLDKSAPTVTGSRSPAVNGNGWNNTNVAVSFTCTDAGPSGIKTCTSPKTLSAEGAGQSASGTATDNADNSATTTVSGINIDKTAPTLSGTPTKPANAAGWYNGDVTIGWNAADTLSGLTGEAPANSTITGEGTGLSATASVTDKAGNTTTTTSAPVNIDRTAPTTGLTGASNNWTNGDVTVNLAATDNLSGVASTAYSVDGGPTQTRTGLTGTSLTLSSEGDHTLTYWSTDRAGNTEQPHSVHVRIDKTAPTISHLFTPLSYHDGAWTNHDVTVTFSCTDPNAGSGSGSGVAACTDPTTVSGEGAGQQVAGHAVDNAGNTASDTATVSIDKTPPTITGVLDRQPNDNGWYDNDVTVTFTAADALSGVAWATAQQVLGEGTDQTATGTATDAAGNSADSTVPGINVDKTKPVLTADFTDGWHPGDVTVRWSCTDALSGVAAGPADDAVTGEGAELTSTATCTDKAGNTATRTVSGIKIDRTAPTTTIDVPDPLPTGWYDGPVHLTLTGHDTLSGLDQTYCVVDGGVPQNCTDGLTVSGPGAHTVSYWSTDLAGNTEDRAANSITLKIDGNPPTTRVINPISPASGWFVTLGIPVAFDATDAESGVAATYYRVDDGETHTYGDPFTADLTDGPHTLTYWSVDLAGNTEAEQTTEVNVDTVAPTITGSQTPAANAFGWNNTDVAVTFGCEDTGSGVQTGVAGCAGATTLANEGADQTVHGDAVDVAGNTSSSDYGPVNIDKTKPSLSGEPTTVPNGAGWYNGDVTIAWSAADALSGIDPAIQPADSTITGEGRDLGAGPVTVADKAGNLSDHASVTGINIDRTAPSITGAATTAPNEAGWYRRGVVVDFACTDTLSGVASCPTSQVIDQDGADQSVPSGPATDRAGNENAGISVHGINVDGTAPATRADNTCTKVNGWCTGDTADVLLTATDQPGLSGVKQIRYQIDGGDVQVAAGDTTTVHVPLSGSGAATLSYWSVDNAGNAETTNSVALKWDNIAPTVTHTLTPTPNTNGWNNADVRVHFAASDDDQGSGVDPSTVTNDVVIDHETAGQSITGSATDVAGNVGTDSLTIRVDKTAPTITAGIVAGAKGANGWYVGPVTVHFTCADALSGIATCPDDVVLTDNGENRATGTATDRAGNTTSTSIGGIMIDREKPAIDAVNVDGRTYTLGAAPTATCTGSDTVSGLASCTVTVSGGTGAASGGVGTFTYTATATDRAGNTTAKTGNYRVIYGWDAFLQPINDTAHQTGGGTSMFKSGSTVPVKFQLTRADGTVVQPATDPVFVSPVRGGSTSAPVDESGSAATTDSGSSYRWDGTARQYVYNWSTKGLAAGYYYRIGVRLDDGQVYTVNIGLR